MILQKSHINSILKVGFACFISTLTFSQGQWCKKASFPDVARHRCTAFAVGTKTYLGGGHINSGTLQTFKDYWQYDPASDSWSQIADFGGGERYHSAAFSIGQFGYVGGGENGELEYTSDFWKYAPLVNTWFPVADLPGQPRRGSSSFVVNGVAYVGLGQSDLGYEADFFRYDQSADEWIAVDSFIGSPRSGAVGFGNGDFGYIGTGHEFGSATKDFYSYNTLSDTWTQLTDVDTTLRQDATGFVINGKGYILTGNNTSGDVNYDDVWEYDFTNDTWTQQTDFPGDGRRYFASCVIGNKGWCTGGTDGTNLKDHWMFDPEMSLGFEEELLSPIVWPNPATEQMNIELQDILEFEDLHVEIVDPTGKILYRTAIGNLLILDKALFGGGIFVVRISNGSSLLFSEKIVFE